MAKKWRKNKNERKGVQTVIYFYYFIKKSPPVNENVVGLLFF